jgi:hypothetical protein
MRCNIERVTRERFDVDEDDPVILPLQLLSLIEFCIQNRAGRGVMTAPPSSRFDAMAPASAGHMELEQPAIIERALGSWAAPGRWSRASLAERYGDVSVQVLEMRGQGGRNPEDSKTSHVTMHLAEYLQEAASGEGQQHYMFDRSWKREQNPFRSELQLPTTRFAGSNSDRDLWSHLTFSFGGDGSGLNFHYHEAALDEGGTVIPPEPDLTFCIGDP